MESLSGELGCKVGLEQLKAWCGGMANRLPAKLSRAGIVSIESKKSKMPIQLNEENGGKIPAVHVSGKLAKADYEHFVR
jgi:hypothetical protein